jgi:hypothetical protein
VPPCDDLAQRLHQLEERLRALEDAEAIRSLKARYAELADARYRGGRVAEPQELARLGDEVAGLFTEDAEWDGGPGLGVCRGRAAIAERFRTPTLLFARHYFVSPRIQLTGDRARADWEVLAPCTTRDGRPHWMAGVEHDEYRRVDGRWLHARMQLELVFFAPHERGWAKKN